MARLSNGKLRKQALRGCRMSAETTSEAWGFVDIARQSGDRRRLARLRRALGV